jgi:hypothetical protein
LRADTTPSFVDLQEKLSLEKAKFALLTRSFAPEMQKAAASA